ncbi:GIY-YIG nuclease family protein [Streptomyces europaeiscabiei]|uniref:GIY-YIG nuclease family protein n=1 Tax=Streptomyces europaeiscabiei TaxID=146819 RepID=UPI0029B73C17|nr:GIY-YIG nuclease family protein [Streptomyces europaeiscabiei]MDX3831987.1 hypothetical protein [Streptomyces europaeiscabiei]
MTIKTVCVIDGCTEQGETVKLGQISGAPSLTLCSQHSWDLFWHGREKSRKLAAAISEANPNMVHTAGFVYVIRVASGRIKIGTTADPSMKRLKSLSDKRNQNLPVQVLAVLKGGESLEAVIQQRWSHLRVQGQMELFWEDPSLLGWAGQQGITPEVDDLEDWLVKKHERGTATSEQTQELRSLIKRGIREEEESSW